MASFQRIHISFLKALPYRAARPNATRTALSVSSQPQPCWSSWARSYDSAKTARRSHRRNGFCKWQGPIHRCEQFAAKLERVFAALRPSIRSRPARRKASISPTIKASTEPFEKPLSDRDAAFSDGLEGLKLTTREMMVLHSLHIKTLQEFLLASDATLSKHLTMTVIATLRDRARLLESRQSAGVLKEIDLSEADFPKHIVTVLQGWV